MNEQSRTESNAILAAAAARSQPGEMIPASPAELAAEAGVGNRLSVARAVRALLARGRIAQEGDGYRLLDPKPLEEGEPASVHRPIRRRRAPQPGPEEPPTYEDLGRALIDRLIEATAEAAELRAALERARTEADAARREAVDVNRTAAGDRRRVESLRDELTALRRRLEMTESNLRTVVEAAKNRPSSPLEDTDARAILDILSTRDSD